MNCLPNREEMNQIWMSTEDVHFDINFFKPIIPSITNFLLEHSKMGDRMLDFGCGHGAKTKVFDKMGYKLFGIDKDINLITKAKEALPDIEFKQIHIDSTLPYEDNSFELIFSCSVFQYMHDHQLILNEFNRILKPGGCIILVENLKNNPITRLGRAYLKFRKLKYQSYPFNHFTYHEFDALQKQYHHSRTAYFHLLSPWSQHRLGKKYYKQFEKIDQFFLRFSVFRFISWIAFFGGVTKKKH